MWKSTIIALGLLLSGLHLSAQVPTFVVSEAGPTQDGNSLVASRWLRVSLPDSSLATLSLYDLQGVLMARRHHAPGGRADSVWLIPVNRWPTGGYLARLQWGGRHYSFQVKRPASGQQAAIIWPE